MSKADSVKEEIGFLKLVFTIFAALDASLIAWLSQNIAAGITSLVIIVLLSVLALTAVLVLIARVLYRRFKQLEGL